MPAKVDALFALLIGTIDPAVNATFNLCRHSTLVPIAQLLLSHRHLEHINTVP